MSRAVTAGRDGGASACSAFTRVTVCTHARVTVFRDTLTEGFSHFVTSIAPRLLPAGAFAGWDLHSLESAALARRTPISDIAWPQMKPAQRGNARATRE